MPKLIDISPVLRGTTAVWPGDVPFSRTVALSIAAGDHLELSSLTTTVHIGAHADAPSHYVAGGQTIEQRPLDLYYGPCDLMRVHVAPGERIRPEHLPHTPRAPRVLLRTGTFPDPDAFNTDFASLSPRLVDHLHQYGVRLIGIDTPSVDPADDAELHSHHALARHDMAVLEGLILEHIPQGVYTLVAFPLRIEGADASPVRAVLIDPRD